MKSHRSLRGFTLIELLIVVAIIAIVVSVLVRGGVSGCVPEESDAIRAAETHGFSHPRVIERHAWASMHGCGEDDAIAYDVEATNPNDRKVRIVVCCGSLGKGCTIRTR